MESLQDDDSSVTLWITEHDTDTNILNCSNPSCPLKSPQQNQEEDSKVLDLKILWTKRLFGIRECALCNLCYEKFAFPCLCRWLPAAWCDMKSLSSQYRTGCTLFEYTKICAPEHWKEFFQPLLVPSQSESNSLLAKISTRITEDADKGLYVTPALQDLYNALDISPEKIKVIILSQDPYKNPGQANGLAFSVNSGIRVPPSLTNIHTEVQNSGFQISRPCHGDLTKWVRQGILLLNAALTTTIGSSGAHSDHWAPFTNLLMEYVLKTAQQRNQLIVGILWGRYAQSHAYLFDQYGHPYIQSAHPSPLSAHRGFIGSKPFEKVNDILKQYNREPVDWSL